MINEEILEKINKEKFRRKLLIASRIIAIFFILAIFFIGFVQINYAKEFNKLKSEHGSLAYCYLCGLENLRRCECQYVYELQEIDIKQYSKNLAENNIRKCDDLNKEPNLSIIDIH